MIWISFLCKSSFPNISRSSLCCALCNIWNIGIYLFALVILFQLSFWSEKMAFFVPVLWAKSHCSYYWFYSMSHSGFIKTLPLASWLLTLGFHLPTYRSYFSFYQVVSHHLCQKWYRGNHCLTTQNKNNFDFSTVVVGPPTWIVGDTWICLLTNTSEALWWCVVRHAHG